MTYDPPTDEIDRQILISELSYIGVARGSLIFCGLIYILFGVVCAPLMLFSMTADPNMDPVVGTIIGIVLALVILGFLGGIGCINLVTARGLKRGKKWAWILSLILGAVYVPSGCLPFGIAILFPLLQEDARKAYLG